MKVSIWSPCRQSGALTVKFQHLDDLIKANLLLARIGREILNGRPINSPLRVSRCLIPRAKALCRFPLSGLSGCETQDSSSFLLHACVCVCLSPLWPHRLWHHLPASFIFVFCCAVFYLCPSFIHPFHFDRFPRLLNLPFDAVVPLGLLPFIYFCLTLTFQTWNPAMIHLLVKTFSPRLHFSALHCSVTHAPWYVLYPHPYPPALFSLLYTFYTRAHFLHT